MSKIIYVAIVLLLFACSGNVSDAERVGELPPNKIRRCHYGSHTDMNDRWHEASEYHCHYWKKSTCIEVHNGEQIPVPCWVEVN